MLALEKRISMVEHMTIGHQVTDPLCENVHFRHLSCGELMKRMLCEAPNSIDSDQEVIHSFFRFFRKFGNLVN